MIGTDVKESIIKSNSSTKRAEENLEGKDTDQHYYLPG